MTTKKQAWLLRPRPHNKDRMNVFKEKEIIAIGWPGIGDLGGKSKSELKEIFSGEPYHYQGHSLGSVYGTANLFVNQMQQGDLVLVPYGDEIYFAEITSDYCFVKEFDNETDGYPHQRKVAWLEETSREKLSDDLRSSLQVLKTAANFSRHLTEIEALAHGQHYVAPSQPDKSSAQPDPDSLVLSYPLRPDYTITFSIPKNLTKEESQRLSNYFATLYFC